MEFTNRRMARANLEAELPNPLALALLISSRSIPSAFFRLRRDQSARRAGWGQERFCYPHLSLTFHISFDSILGQLASASPPQGGERSERSASKQRFDALLEFKKYVLIKKTNLLYQSTCIDNAHLRNVRPRILALNFTYRHAHRVFPL